MTANMAQELEEFVSPDYTLMFYSVVSGAIWKCVRVGRGGGGARLIKILTSEEKIVTVNMYNFAMN